MSRERTRGGFGVLRLHGENDALELSIQLIRSEGGDSADELRQRSLDPKSGFVDRCDVFLCPVDERDVVSSAGEMRTDCAADRAGAPDQEFHGTRLR